MLRDITIGQHLPGNSPVHRLDPRLKLLLTLAYIVVLFVFQNPLGLALCIVFLAALYMLARIPARMMWRTLKPLIPILVLTTLINLFFTKSGTVLVEFWVFTVTSGGVAHAVQMAVRIGCLLIGTALLTYTTSPIALTDAIERLLRPLSKLRFPSHELAMMMTIALRFIPVLIEETDKIMSAQKARGALLDTGGIVQRVKALVPVLIPLFLSAFRRADDLAMAMECRCYRGGEGRTALRRLRITKSDILSVLVCVLMFVAVGFSGPLWALTGVVF